MSQDFPCFNAPYGCDGRVTVKGTICARPCNCRALEREAERLIEELPHAEGVCVGRSSRGKGELVITVVFEIPRYGEGSGLPRLVRRHDLHLAIVQALECSDITRNHPFSLVIV